MLTSSLMLEDFDADAIAVGINVRLLGRHAHGAHLRMREHARAATSSQRVSCKWIWPCAMRLAMVRA